MAQDARLKRPAEDQFGREDRALDDRAVTEDLASQDPVRAFSMRNSEFLHQALPNPPDLKGYRLFWASTTNAQDPVHARLRLGYEVVKATDMPSFDNNTLKSGQWEGCIGVNEMILLKLPEHLWQKYMKELYHDAPLEEASKLRANVDVLKEQAKRFGSSLMTGSGYDDLAKNTRPRFE